MSRSEGGTASDAAGEDSFYTPQTNTVNTDNISRVIVKNLPKYITPEQVRKHFSVRGYTITDLKFAKTHDGRFRRFAFIGFANGKEAKDCQAYFNNTYLDTSRLQVDLALAIGDSNLPRAWSRHSKGSSAYIATHPEESDAFIKKKQHESEQQRLRLELEKKRKFLYSIYGAEEAMDDPTEAAELEKYLQAMKTKSQTKTWENDDETKSNMKASSAAAVKVNVKSVKSKKAGGEGILIPKVHMKFEEEAAEGYFEKSDDEDLYEDFKSNYNLEENAENQNQKENQTEALPSTETQTPQAHNPAQSSTSKYEQLSPDLIAESGRLFVRNLSYAVTEDDLEKLFSAYGPLSQVHLPIAKDTKRPKGMAYILFMLPDDALKAYTALDGTIFQGRLLHILPAKEQPSEHVEKANNYKAKKEQELKAISSSSHNWNSLFIRSDVVLDAIAARLGVPKSSIMNAHESDSLATRLAIAETHIVQETKEYLESEGVFLDAFVNNSNVERSKTVILVKNLPFEVEASELRSMFTKFGALGRVILPPLTRSIALIEFLEGNEAKSAFRALAYSNFHGAPLFLEWAPMDSLHERRRAVEAEPSSRVVLKEAIQNSNTVESQDSKPAQHSNTLYVKNLSFKTEVSAFKSLFASIGPIRSARIPTKPSPSNANVQLSLGFGFIEFTNSEDVNRALDRLQGAQLDGHVLILKKASAGNFEAKPESSKKRKTEEIDESTKPCKLLIRNIPFEATEAEVRNLLKSFTAAIKRIRIPKKFDGSHRGFGFAEFTSHAEAKHVKETLAATHLYGRHLVIEWAKVGEDENMNKMD